MRPFASTDEALLWLDSHFNFETKSLSDLAGSAPPTLDGIRLLLDALGNPQTSLRTIHVAGTNGKGSTSRIISRILMEYGLSVGTFLSPHLQAVNERWQLNLLPISDELLTENLTIIAAATSLLAGDSPRLTYFTIVTALALSLFANEAVDVSVVEVGMGGRFDSTNAIDGDVAVITNIAIDHAIFLGETREQIAGEKAGIIKPNSAVVLGENDPGLLPIFEDQNGASYVSRGRDFDILRNELAFGGRVLDLRIGEQDFEEVFVSLHGAHQAANVATALSAVQQFFGRELDEDVIRAALSDIDIPGRLEVVHHEPTVILDGAHNAHSADALVAALEEDFGVSDNAVLVFGALDGHDVAATLAQLTDLAPKYVVLTATDSARAITPEDLAPMARSVFPDAVLAIKPRVSDAVNDAIAHADVDDVVVVAGSFRIVGEARTQLVPRPAESSETSLD